jgi:hypothetical protein
MSKKRLVEIRRLLDDRVQNLKDYFKTQNRSSLYPSATD